MWRLLTGETGGASPQQIHTKIMGMRRVPNAARIIQLLSEAITNARGAQNNLKEGQVKDVGHDNRIWLYEEAIQKLNTQLMRDKEIDAGFLKGHYQNF